MLWGYLFIYFKEVSETIKHPHKFNHEDGYRLSKAYFPCSPQHATHPTTSIAKQ
jgi:hypothetical protein